MQYNRIIFYAVILLLTVQFSVQSDEVTDSEIPYEQCITDNVGLTYGSFRRNLNDTQWNIPRFRNGKPNDRTRFEFYNSQFQHEELKISVYFDDIDECLMVASLNLADRIHIHWIMADGRSGERCIVYDEEFANNHSSPFIVTGAVYVSVRAQYNTTNVTFAGNRFGDLCINFLYIPMVNTSVEFRSVNTTDRNSSDIKSAESWLTPQNIIIFVLIIIVLTEAIIMLARELKRRRPSKSRLTPVEDTELQSQGQRFLDEQQQQKQRHEEQNGRPQQVQPVEQYQPQEAVKEQEREQEQQR